MKIIAFDSQGGASGDMTLAALIHLGADINEIRRSLEGLGIGRFSLEVENCVENGLAGARVNVHVEEEHGHHGHSHSHRNLSDIRHILEHSSLPGPVVAMAVKVFERLADAEAAVHGVSPDEIHFHEVGAVDSIVDIAGSCLALSQFAPDAICVGTLPLGQGSTTCAHGVLPVPVPAVVKLLSNMPVEQTGEPFELVTPTGAALLSSWKSAERPPPGSRIIGAGYGWGRRKLKNRPNLLRAILLEYAPGQEPDRECLVMESNVDDTVPELLGSLVNRLLEAGALDAYITPVQMKKQRPGALLTVLCAADLRDTALDLIFRESTTLGVRISRVERVVLARRVENVETPYGVVRVKVGQWQGRDVTRSPEHDDCVRLAAARGAPVREVYESALRAAQPKGAAD